MLVSRKGPTASEAIARRYNLAHGKEPGRAFQVLRAPRLGHCWRCFGRAVGLVGLLGKSCSPGDHQRECHRPVCPVPLPLGVYGRRGTAPAPLRTLHPTDHPHGGAHRAARQSIATAATLRRTLTAMCSLPSPTVAHCTQLRASKLPFQSSKLSGVCRPVSIARDEIQSGLSWPGGDIFLDLLSREWMKSAPEPGRCQWRCEKHPTLSRGL